MKILQVFDFFSPFGGGVASVVKQMSQGLQQQGHDVTIFSTDNKTDPDYIKSVEGVGVKLFKINVHTQTS